MLSDERKELLAAIRSLLDIPVYFWESTNYDPDVLGARNAGIFKRYLERRAKAEESAEQELARMTDLQLFNLYNESVKLEEFRSTHDLFDPPPWYAGGFGSRPVKNYEHWFRLEFWTLTEAVCLSIGFDPKAPELPKPNGHVSPYEAVNLFRDRYELMERAFEAAQEREPRIAPSKVVEWIKKNGLEVPAAFQSAVNELAAVQPPSMLRKVDERRYHSAQKVVLALLAELYGDLESSSPSERVSDIYHGLEKLGLSMDRKTIKSAVELAEKNLSRFQNEQHQKDERDS